MPFSGYFPTQPYLSSTHITVNMVTYIKKCSRFVHLLDLPFFCFNYFFRNYGTVSYFSNGIRQTTYAWCHLKNKKPLENIFTSIKIITTACHQTLLCTRYCSRKQSCFRVPDFPILLPNWNFKLAGQGANGSHWDFPPDFRDPQKKCRGSRKQISMPIIRVFYFLSCHAPRSMFEWCSSGVFLIYGLSGQKHLLQ